MFLRFPTATVATRWQDACFAPLRFLLWHGLRTMPLLRPKVSSSPDYFRDIDSVSRSALSGRQWDAVWVAKTGTWRMHREQKRRPSVRRAWRGLETTPQPGGFQPLSFSVLPPQRVNEEYGKDRASALPSVLCAHHGQTKNAAGCRVYFAGKMGTSPISAEAREILNAFSSLGRARRFLHSHSCQRGWNPCGLPANSRTWQWFLRSAPGQP